MKILKKVQHPTCSLVELRVKVTWFGGKRMRLKKKEKKEKKDKIKCLKKLEIKIKKENTKKEVKDQEEGHELLEEEGHKTNATNVAKKGILHENVLLNQQNITKEVVINVEKKDIFKEIALKNNN